MAIRNKWKRGDFLRQDDRTGFTVYASQTSKEWQGLIVRNESWEPRHPQDFVRGVPDRQNVPEARPIPNILPSVGPFVTSLFADYSIGDTALTVASIASISSGDTLRIILDGGLTTTTVATEGGGTATGGYHMTINTGLTGAAAAGNVVMDLTSGTVATEGY